MNESLDNKEETTYRSAKEIKHGETQKSASMSEKCSESKSNRLNEGAIYGSSSGSSLSSLCGEEKSKPPPQGKPVSCLDKLAELAWALKTTLPSNFNFRAGI
jgi:hypothetical protein